MRNRWLWASLCLLFLPGTTKAQGVRDGVEVLYFHGKRRCATCLALERLSREVVTQDYAEACRAGRVRYRVVDVTTADGVKTARAYRVTGSALYVNRWRDGKEMRRNLTREGFATARRNPEGFKQTLRAAMGCPAKP